MNIKWLIFGIILMETSLMQAAIFEITNESREKKEVNFYVKARPFNSIIGSSTINPKETIEINTGNKRVIAFSIVESGIWYEIVSAALQAKEKEIVNILVTDNGYCTIIRETRGIIKSPFLETGLELEEAAR